jgi:NAD(P)-dependent dehydrogenase (short-subunit alcohol dehydrogenase family)
VSKVWFVTGASRGLGREFARAALGRGDQVAAAARRLESLDDLTATYGSAILPLRRSWRRRRECRSWLPPA